MPNACDSGSGLDGHGWFVTVRLFVSYNGGATLESVSLCASCTLPIYLATDTVVLPSLAGGNRTPTIVPFVFRARADVLPVDLGAVVVATYTSHSGEPRCAQCAFRLPLSLISAVIPPVKNPKYKVTLDTNRMPPPLPALFEDLVAGSSAAEVGASALSVAYHCGLDATVLVSKNAGRYRVQSSSFEGLWVLADELVRRLTAYFGLSSRAEGGEDPFAVLYAEPLPLQEFFEVIDEHLRCRNALSGLHEQLSQRAHQFRVIEKRLLVRLKDRNPAPLQNLELLFDGTYKQLVRLSDSTEAAQNQLAFHAVRLSASTRLLLLLLRLRFRLDADDAEILEAHLTPVVDEAQDQGWQERVDVALTQLLRTTLSKSGKESASASAPQALACPSDATKLKKHISLVVDRLSKRDPRARLG